MIHREKGKLVWLESDWLQIADDHQDDRDHENQNHQDGQDKGSDFDPATILFDDEGNIETDD